MCAFPRLPALSATPRPSHSPSGPGLGLGLLPNPNCGAGVIDLRNFALGSTAAVNSTCTGSAALLTDGAYPCPADHWGSCTGGAASHTLQVTLTVPKCIREIRMWSRCDTADSGHEIAGAVAEVLTENGWQACGGAAPDVGAGAVFSSRCALLGDAVRIRSDDASAVLSLAELDVFSQVEGMHRGAGRRSPLRIHCAVAGIVQDQTCAEEGGSIGVWGVGEPLALDPRIPHPILKGVGEGFSRGQFRRQTSFVPSQNGAGMVPILLALGEVGVGRGLGGGVGESSPATVSLRQSPTARTS